MAEKDLVTVEQITKKIYLIRGSKVMLDWDLADLYRVKRKNLKQSVRRNISRFPEDFMFKLSKEEFAALKSHIAVSDSDDKNLRSAPMAFTEQGVAMLSSILRSDRAIQVNIQIIRIFTKMRDVISENKELRKTVEELKQQTDELF
ncbi:ORF6N domain-containing protein [uncultured Desulfobacter sp.]|uniref:ORF6N domain-containing protein n=1 Tax=uncultured Desulfobacter sp. TaxID=240139 RepID=UPI002AAB3D77|nr:ORF6N domain-containing protein [uncultured Desulfobacter sp.]